MGDMSGGSRRAREERKRAAVKAAARAAKRAASRGAREAAEIAELQAAIDAGAPPPGSNPLATSSSGSGALSAPGAGYAAARSFDELPISGATKASLREAGYIKLTAIQRASLPHALAGRDVLGAAKTGSGKTLAFLLPVCARSRSTCFNAPHRPIATAVALHAPHHRDSPHFSDTHEL